MLPGLFVIEANVALGNILIALWALKAEKSRASTASRTSFSLTSSRGKWK